MGNNQLHTNIALLWNNDYWLNKETYVASRLRESASATDPKPSCQKINITGFKQNLWFWILRFPETTFKILGFEVHTQTPINLQLRYKIRTAWNINWVKTCPYFQALPSLNPRSDFLSSYRMFIVQLGVMCATNLNLETKVTIVAQKSRCMTFEHINVGKI